MYLTLPSNYHTSPAQVPPVHYKYYEDDLQANLRSEVNPFPLHSEWVDRDIKVGDIDEAVSSVNSGMLGRIMGVSVWC